MRLLPHAGIGPLSAAILLNLAFGVLPSAFIIFMSRVLVLREPTPIVLATALAIAVGALVLQQALGPFQAALGEVIAHRIDGVCAQRLMRAAFEDAPIATLETPGVLDRLADMRAAFNKTLPTPGEAAAGTLALLARYTQLAGAVALTAWALHVHTAALVLVTALIIRFGQRGSLGRFAGMWEGLAGYRRRSEYLRALSSGPDAAKEIRVLGLLGWMRGRLDRSEEDYFGAFWAERRRLLFWPFVGFAGAGLVGASLAFADLASTPLSLLDYAIAVQALLVPIRFGVYFPECDSQTQFGWHAYRALLDFERTTAESVALHGKQKAPALRNAIRFEGVGFAYPHHPVFERLDLHIPVGRSTAIVGLNGAGKTTLVKLLARFYDPDSGRITVDGTDLRDVDPRDWHRRLAVIFQDFVRYELPIGDNISLGGSYEGADGDVVPFARYPGGRDLSGGQWQRIALARALHAAQRGASILVLDEPTAQLDVRAEVEFFDGFLERTHGLTTIVISHRFSTVRRADNIVVLAGGRVVEQGSHDGLMALDGEYARLFRLQAARFADMAAGAA